MFILLFLLPPAYLLLYYLLKGRRQGSNALPVCLACALAVGLIPAGLVSYSPGFAEATQLAWAGVTGDGGDAPVIGGRRADAVVGWPNGSFAPTFRAAAVGDSLVVETEGGGAFVVHDVHRTFLNGAEVTAGATIKLDGKLLWLEEARRTPTGRRRVDLRIADEDGEPLPRFRLPEYSSSNDRVLSLRTLIEARGAETPEEAALLSQLVRWAEDKRLALTREGSVRVLGSEKRRAKCAAPCRVWVMWVHSKLPLEVSRDGDDLAMRFLPPWRAASWLPPASEDGARRVTVTAQAQPGEAAFEVPFGEASVDPRQVLTLASNAAGRTVISAPRSEAGVELPGEPASGREQTPCATAGSPAVTSCAKVKAGWMSLLLATIDNSLRATGLIWRLAAAYVCLLFGMVLLNGSLRGSDPGRLTLALVTCFWTFLVFRLCVALRFVLDPDQLTAHTVKGLAVTLTGLTVAPGLVVLWVCLRLRFDAALDGDGQREAHDGARPARGPTLSLVAYSALLAVCCLVQVRGVAGLWNYLPPRYAPRLGLLFAGVFFVCFSYSALILWLSRDPSRTASRAAGLLAAPLRLDVLVASASRRWWAGVGGERLTFRRAATYLLLSLSLFCLLPSLLSLLPRLVAARLFFSEVFAPLLLGIIPALFWLGSTQSPDVAGAMGRAEPSWRYASLLAALFVVVPAFAVPFFVRDVGKVFVMLALLVSLVFILAADWRRRPAAAAALGVLCIVAVMSYACYDPQSPLLPETARVRLLAFREGRGVERRMPYADVTERGEGLPWPKLREAYAHTWENRAMAHAGGWLGLGFGRAPVEQSQVRPDFIQFDSLYSFYIVGEHGLLGGLALLLLYAAPLLLLLFGARREGFDFGLSGALIIASTFLFEAWLHAAMNVGILPFTGRSMPLINANSITDLLRWLILFGLMGQMLCRRTRSSDERVATAPLPPRRSRARVTACFVTFYALCVCVVAWGNWRALKDETAARPLEWRGFLAEVNEMIRAGVISVDQKQARLLLRPDGETLPKGSLLIQEAWRFNSLPREERIGRPEAGKFAQRLHGLRSIEDYDRLLDDLRRDELGTRTAGGRGLFRLTTERCPDDGAAKGDCHVYRVSPNPHYNQRLGFRLAGSEAEIARIGLRGEARPLVGPTWVAGRWVTAYDYDLPLPWVGQLARALEAEARRLGKGEAEELYGVLTLDRGLQEVADGFAAARGREMHRRRFEHSAYATFDTYRKTVLPPRVALTVLRVPTGEVLALGGYPRATPRPFWQTVDGNSRGEGWMPPAGWLNERDLPFMRELYVSDRNLEPIEAGRHRPRRKLSFWAREWEGNYVSAGVGPELLRAISPSLSDTQLAAADAPDACARLLLDAAPDEWSNVELAAGFSTCLTGRPTVAHIADGGRPFRHSADRKLSPEVARRLRAELSAALTTGVASRELGETGATTFLRSLNGHRVYLQTGTWRGADGSRPVSRATLAVVRWENESEGEARAGLVFSLLGDDAESATALRWLGEFLVQNRARLDDILNGDKPL